MTTNERGVELHRKATVLSQPITDSERAELESWYARMDAEEAEILSRSPESRNVAALQAELDQAVVKLVQTAQELGELHQRNSKLRQEVEALERKAAEKLAPKAS